MTVEVLMSGLPHDLIRSSFKIDGSSLESGPV